MAITTYAELQTAIANQIHRADLTSRIPEFITRAEDRIYREVRAREMETSFSDTTSSNSISLPTSYLELKYAYVDKDSDQHLKRVDASMIYEKYPNSTASSSRPYFIAREGSTFIFGPRALDNLTIAGYYWKNLGAVADSAHALFTGYPDLYLFGSMVNAYEYTKDFEAAQYYEMRYIQQKDLANGLNVREDYSGSDLQMRPA